MGTTHAAGLYRLDGHISAQENVRSDKGNTVKTKSSSKTKSISYYKTSWLSSDSNSIRKMWKKTAKVSCILLFFNFLKKPMIWNLKSLTRLNHKKHFWNQTMTFLDFCLATEVCKHYCNVHNCDTGSLNRFEAHLRFERLKMFLMYTGCFIPYHISSPPFYINSSD